MKLDTFKDRTQAAARADVLAAARVLGLPLVRRGFSYVLRDDPEVIITRRGWKSSSGRTGQAGMFAAGNAIHLAIEHAGLGYREAVEAIASGLWPDQVPQTKVKEEDRVPFSRKVARIRMERELGSDAGSEPFKLPEATAVESDHRRCEKWMQRLGIDQSIVRPLLEHGVLYTRPRGNVTVFPSYSADGKPNGAYTVNHMGSGTRKALDGTSPLAGWLVPGKGDVLHVFQSPLDLLAYTELERRAGRVCTVPRLALFPGGPKALAHHVLLSAAKEAVLHLPAHSEDMLSAGELTESVKSYVKVMAAPPPNGLSLLDALASTYQR